MPSERFSIGVDAPGVAEVDAALDEPQGPAAPWIVLLAHGAGSSLDSPEMAALAAGLAERGLGVLRFNYPYRQRALRAGRQGTPDARAVLEDAHRRALRELERRARGRRVVLAGKSMGGRIASHMAALDEPCRALVFFGYPLHPAGHPAGRPAGPAGRARALRDEHFPALVQPALFLQGTRDALCDLELLRASLAKYGGRATLHVVEHADHSFDVPRSSGRTKADVRAELLDRVLAWLQHVDPD